MVDVKHTPTPWISLTIDDEKGSEEYGSAFIIGDNLGGLVCAALPLPTELDDGDFSRVEANAAHIVKCVNMHDELVEALKKSHMAIAASLLIACGIYPTQNNIDQTIDESETGTIIGDIRETLAKARGD